MSSKSINHFVPPKEDETTERVVVRISDWIKLSKLNDLSGYPANSLAKVKAGTQGLPYELCIDGKKRLYEDIVKLMVRNKSEWKMMYEILNAMNF